MCINLYYLIYEREIWRSTEAKGGETLDLETLKELDARDYYPKYDPAQLKAAKALMQEVSNDVTYMSMAERLDLCKKWCEIAMVRDRQDRNDQIALLPINFCDRSQREFARLELADEFILGKEGATHHWDLYERSDETHLKFLLERDERDHSFYFDTPCHPDTIVACIADTQGMFSAEKDLNEAARRFVPFGGVFREQCRVGWVAVAQQCYTFRNKRQLSTDGVDAMIVASYTKSKNWPCLGIGEVGKKLMMLLMEKEKYLPPNPYAVTAIKTADSKGMILPLGLQLLLHADWTYDRLAELGDEAVIVSGDQSLKFPESCAGKPFSKFENPFKSLIEIWKKGYVPVDVSADRNVLLMRDIPESANG